MPALLNPEVIFMSMNNSNKAFYERVLKYLWLGATIILLGQAVYYTITVGLAPSAKFYLLSGISFLFFIRRHYFSK